MDCVFLVLPFLVLYWLDEDESVDESESELDEDESVDESEFLSPDTLSSTLAVQQVALQSNFLEAQLL